MHTRAITHLTKRCLGALLLGALLLGAAPGAAAGEPPAAAPGGQDPGEETRPELFYSILYRLDGRVMGHRLQEFDFELMAAEAEIFGSYGDNLDFAIQVPVYTEMRGRGRDMHFGNLFVVYRPELGKPRLRVGQFVIPFGNLYTYETHTRPVQTLYRYSLGTRIDLGAELSGFLGPGTEFQLSATTGHGPFRLRGEEGPVVSARVARQFEIGDNDLRLGLSALTGRLPVFSVMTDPVMDRGEVLEFTRKNRFALDAEYYHGPVLLRAELVGGDDRGRAVYGHWLQVEYPLSFETALLAGTERWSQAHGQLTGVWGGVEHRFTTRQTARLIYQNTATREHGMRMQMPMVIGQFLIEF